MFEFLNPLREMTVLTVWLRMILATVFGMVIGLNRSAKNRPAGVRTHILVCLGAATAAMTGLYIVLKMGMLSDISRISAQVVSGLGFIVAGTIVVTQKKSIKGLTTAAGLWTTGLIGLALGSGYYEMALLATILVLVAETLCVRLEDKIPRLPEYVMEIRYNEKDSLDNALRYLKDKAVSILNLKIHSLEENGDAKYAAEVRFRGSCSGETLTAHVAQMPGITGAALR